MNSVAWIAGQRPRSLITFAALGMLHLLSLTPVDAADLISVEGTLSGEVSWYHPDFGDPVIIPADGDSGSFSEEFLGTSNNQTWSAEVTPRNSRVRASFTVNYYHPSPTPSYLPFTSLLQLSGTSDWVVFPNGAAGTVVSGTGLIESQIVMEITNTEIMTFSGATSGLGLSAEVTAHWLSSSGESWTASMDELKSGPINLDPGILTLSTVYDNQGSFINVPPLTLSFAFRETVVPEPGSLLLLGAAAMSFLTRRRQKGQARLV